MNEEIQSWTIPFGMFIEQITNLEDVEDAEWEEEND